MFVVKQQPAFVSLADLQTWLANWHREKFGYATPNLIATYAKLGQELGELAEELSALLWEKDEARKGERAHEMAVEAADCVFVLCHLIRALGFGLGETLLAKLQVIFDRLGEDRRPPPDLPRPPAGAESATHPNWFDPDKVPQM